MKKLFYIILLLLTAVMAQSCSDKDDPKPEPKYNHTIFVYMIATNSLSADAGDDLYEMETGYAKMLAADDDTQLVVYKCRYNQLPTLERLTADGWETLKTYDDAVSSATRERMSLVMDDVRELMPSRSYGLVCWSHSLAWTPTPPKESEAPDLQSGAPTPLWYGDDSGEHLNIDEMARAIPDDMFSYIWMDCCLMSSVEVAYQLRDKCRWYVASPTVLMGEGMPYQHTLPYLKPDPESLKEAMQLEHAYYKNTNYTGALVDMKLMPELAAAAKAVYANYEPQDVTGVQEYYVSAFDRYFDFRQYSERVASATGTSDALDAFYEALDRAVVYKIYSPFVLFVQIDQSLYSGISCHAFENNGRYRDEYYKTLDWYKAVYPTE